MGNGLTNSPINEHQQPTNINEQVKRTTEYSDLLEQQAIPCFKLQPNYTDQKSGEMSELYVDFLEFPRKRKHSHRNQPVKLFQNCIS